MNIIKPIIEKFIRLAFSQGFDAAIRDILSQLKTAPNAQKQHPQREHSLSDFTQLAVDTRIIRRNCIRWGGLTYTSPELICFASYLLNPEINPQASLYGLPLQELQYKLLYNPENISTLAVFQGNDFLCFIRAIELRQMIVHILN